jgi:hypothetical protein
MVKKLLVDHRNHVLKIQIKLPENFIELDTYSVLILSLKNQNNEDVHTGDCNQHYVFLKEHLNHKPVFQTDAYRLNTAIASTIIDYIREQKRVTSI